jgi:hypothetical protein
LRISNYRCAGCTLKKRRRRPTDDPAQRRERKARLMTGDAVAATIAHEVNQPLSGMIMNADAGLRWLDRSMPDLTEAKAAFQQKFESRPPG